MGYRGTGKGYISSHGYKVHGSRTYREYEHRLIAAKSLGRPLLKSEEVHHFDENGANNSRGNLIICTRAFHKYLHFMDRLRANGITRALLIQWHHSEGLPLEEIKRRLGLGEGMIGRWFKRMNIKVNPGVGGKGSLKYRGLLPNG